MEDAKSFMISTEPATEGLFKLLNQYSWRKMQAFVDAVNSKTREELEEHKTSYSSTDVAREVISGSILQIAFVALKQHAKPMEKSPGALHFEAEMNRLISENPTARIKKFVLPDEFCIGREIGNMPIGMIIFAARNQYNHFYEDRLKRINEVVFNYLNTLWPDPPNGVSFNLYDCNSYYSFSTLAALGWTDTKKESGHAKYKADLSGILGIEF